MSAERNIGPFTMTSGEALAKYRFVKISSSTAVYADAGEEPVGITYDACASGDNVAIYPLQGCIEKITAGAVIASGAALYVAADGKASSTAVGKQIGIAFTAATADTAIIDGIIWGPRGGNDLFATKGGNIEFWDDFFAYDATATVGGYAEVTDGGTIAVTDGAGGVLSIATGATDENESYVSSMTEAFLFSTTKRLFFEARVKLTEAATDDANIIVGLSDTVAANSLVDAGAGPMASYDGVTWSKVDGGVVWTFETSNAGTQVTTASAGAFASATWYKLGFLYDYNDGVTALVTPILDGVAGTAKNLVIAGLAEMHILLGAKAGGSNAETLLVDYVHVITER
ncbi:MAG TPA: capsid cement protein [Phycisphaerae bacterium]|nr:capsid cement protein [Phycisphaerae bacterium]